MRIRNDFDREHLRLLAIFHYIAAGLLVLCGCFPSIYIPIGIVILNDAGHGQPPPAMLGVMFIVVPSILMVFMWLTAVLTLIAGHSLGNYRRYRFCQIVSGLLCLWLPFGTILGIFTLVVLARSGVRVLFGMEEPRELIFDPRDEIEDDDPPPAAPLPPSPSPPDDGSYRAG